MNDEKLATIIRLLRELRDLREIVMTMRRLVVEYRPGFQPPDAAKNLADGLQAAATHSYAVIREVESAEGL
jgi:allophanate hydrolase subunit 1